MLFRKEKEGATDRSTVRQSVVGCGCDNMVYFETAGQRFCGMGQSPGNVMADGMAGFCVEILSRSCWGSDRIALQLIWNRCYREARYYLTKAILPVRFLRMRTMNGLPR